MALYKFGEIAFNSTEKKKPVESDKYVYIGLEHLDSRDLHVNRWGSDVAPIGDKLIMKKGDVLFGKRRAYQKKVAIAPFDGIFSAHGLVLRPKEDVIDKEFFPFFISSDYFLDAAIKISVGSLSPTINWGDLKELEFNLPSMDEQKRLAKILMAAEETRQAYKKLIKQTDNVIYAELLRNIENENNFVKISDFTEVVTGGTPSTSRKDYWENGTVPWLASGCCQDSIVSETNTYITELGYKNSAAKMMPKHTIMIALTGATAGKVGYLNFEACGNQSITGILPSDKVLPVYLFYYMCIQRQKILNDCIGAAQPHISQGYVKNFAVPIIDMKKQKEFVAFAEQAEQTKIATQHSLDALNETVRALVNRNFN